MAVMTTRRAILRLRGSAGSQVSDDLAVEAPLTLSLDDDVLAVVMRTPGHDLELAAGWLVAESGVRDRQDIATMRESRDGDGVRISLRPGVTPPRSRAFITSASCGVCSADMLDLMPPQTSAPHSPGWHVDRGVLAGLPDADARAATRIRAHGRRPRGGARDGRRRPARVARGRRPAQRRRQGGRLGAARRPAGSRRPGRQRTGCPSRSCRRPSRPASAASSRCRLRRAWPSTSPARTACSLAGVGPRRAAQRLRRAGTGNRLICLREHLHGRVRLNRRVASRLARSRDVARWQLPRRLRPRRRRACPRPARPGMW